MPERAPDYRNPWLLLYGSDGLHTYRKFYYDEWIENFRKALLAGLTHYAPDSQASDQWPLKGSGDLYKAIALHDEDDPGCHGC